MSINDALMHKCSHRSFLLIPINCNQLRLLDSRVQILPLVSLDINGNKFNLSQQLFLLCTTETEVLLGYLFFFFLKALCQA